MALKVPATGRKETPPDDAKIAFEITSGVPEAEVEERNKLLEGLNFLSPDPSEEEKERETLLNALVEKSTKQREIGEIRQDKSRGPLEDQVMGFNMGIASMLDMVGSPISFPLEKLGLPFSTDGVKKFFRTSRLSIPSLGIEGDTFLPPEGKEPDTASFKAGRFLADVMFMEIFGGPLLRGIEAGAPLFAGGIKSVGQVIKGGLKKLGEGQAARPIASATSSVVTSQLAGYGGAALDETFGDYKSLKEKFPDSITAAFFDTFIPSAEFGGQIIGGASPVFFPIGIAKKGAEFFYARFGQRFLKKFGESRAATRLQKSLTEKEIALARKKLKESDLPPEAEGLVPAGVKTEDEFILEVHKSLIELSDSAKVAENKELTVINDIILRFLKGDTTRNTEFAIKDQVKAQISFIVGAFKKRLQLTGVIAAEKIQKAGPTIERAEANRIVERELETIRNLAAADERTLWALVPKHTFAPVGLPMKVWEQLLRERKLATRSSDFLLSGDSDTLFKLLGTLTEKGEFIPGLLSKRGKNTIGELQELRSRLLSELRSESSRIPLGTGFGNKVRILNKLQEAVLDAMGAADASISFKNLANDGVTGMAQEQIAIALAYSRKMQDFNKGVVGKILGSARAGGDIIAPSLSLETAFGATGPKAAESLKKIVEALSINLLPKTGVNPTTAAVAASNAAVESWIKHKFAASFVNGETININGARKFMTEWEEVLKLVPQVRADLQEAIRTNSIKLVRERKFKTLESNAYNKNMSKAAMFLEDGPDNTFRAIMKSRDPAAGMQKLLDKTSLDKTGNSLDGLQGLVFDWMRREASYGGVAAKPQFISGFKLSAIVNDPGAQLMLKKLFKNAPHKLERLQQFTNLARLSDLRIGAVPSKEGVIGDRPAIVFELASQILGARAGTKVAKATGTGGIQLQAIFSKLGLSKLREAIRDPALRVLSDAFGERSGGKLMDTLLSRPTTPEHFKQVEKQLKLWIVEVLHQAGERSLGELDKEQDSDNEKEFPTRRVVDALKQQVEN